MATCGFVSGEMRNDNHCLFAEPTSDDQWTHDFDNRQSTLSRSYSGCLDIWHQEVARIER